MVKIPQVPNGCRVIPLWRNVSGNNFRPIYEIIDYTVIDEVDFDKLNQYRWFIYENSRGDKYVLRRENRGGKYIHIYMSREILGLPHGIGHGGDEADHVDHNTLNNRRNNLRKATSSQSKANTRGHSYHQMPKGVHKHGRGYEARISVNGLSVSFSDDLCKVEAGLKYKYAAIILHDKFACYTEITTDEMPSRRRRWELLGMVIDKLREKGYV